MTAHDLLRESARLGVRLEAHGDRLHVEARRGALTPEFRNQLATHKPALLALLAPVTGYVTLKGGLTLPVEALRLAWSLEDRGFTMALDESQQFQITPTATLTNADRAGIARWRRHLSAILCYTADAPEAVQ